MPLKPTIHSYLKSQSDHMDDIWLCSRLALPDNEAKTFLLIAKATRHGGGLNASTRELAGELLLSAWSVEDVLRRLIARKLIKRHGSGKKAAYLAAVSNVEQAKALAHHQ